MKYRTLQKWDDPEGCHGLILFAQLLEELLFDYSIDTYKSSVMQTGTLCYEALLTLSEIEAGNIKAPNLSHVLAELCASYEKDDVAQNLVTLNQVSFFGIFKNPKSSRGEIKTILEIMLRELEYNRYKIENEKLLIAEIEGTQSAVTIRKLTRSYLTTLSWGGFNQKYIQEIGQDFFHYGQNRIGSSAAIRDFLAKFNDDSKEHTTVFRVDSAFNEIQSTAKKIGIDIFYEMPDDLIVHRHLLPLASSGEVYAVIRKIPAKDRFVARESAESKLKLSQTLLNLFHHKNSLSWIGDCLILDGDLKTPQVSRKLLNPMLKCVDRKIGIAGFKLEKFVQEFSLENDSFSKFIRSSLLHTMALDSDSGENQLLNLWISLESLIPSETKADDVSNIEHIVNSLLPFLNMGYLRRLVNNLVKDLLRWDKKEVTKAFRDVEGAKFHEKLTRIITLEEHRAKRDSIEKSINAFYLLRDRFDYFKNLFASPENVSLALDTHRIRLEWQIRRIYRTRNIIVHSGTAPRFTNQLIEHTHDYLDIVLDSLVRLASSPQIIESVGQGFKYVELQYKNYLTQLSVRGLAFDNKNISELVFGKI